MSAIAEARRAAIIDKLQQSAKLWVTAAQSPGVVGEAEVAGKPEAPGALMDAAVAALTLKDAPTRLNHLV